MSTDLLLRILAVLLSAGMLPLISPPIGLHWLHWVAYVPLLAALHPSTPRRNRWLGYLFGLVGVALVFAWLVETIVLFSNIPQVLAIAILLLFSAAFGLPYLLLWGAVHPLRERLGSAWVLGIPALLVLIEYVTSFVFLFPYTRGSSQYQTFWIWQMGSVTGVWGISFLVLMVNCVLAEAIYRQQEGRPPPWAWAGATVAVLASVLGFGAWRHEQVEATLDEAPVLRVAQLQSSKTMIDRLTSPPRHAFDAWVKKTRAIEPGSVDLVVWPEGASPYPIRDRRVAHVFRDLAREGGFEMLVGGGAREQRVTPEHPDGRWISFNSVYMVRQSGEITERYDKMVPLPFGEYMPLIDVFPVLEKIEGVGAFQAGEEPILLRGEGYSFAAPICYEAILGYATRWFDEPDILVNVTNDAWFGDTAAPHQHAMLAAGRTVELGLPMIRSAYTGVSMIIEPHGHIRYETAPFAEVNRPVQVRVADIPTFYRQWGDWFVTLSGLGLLGGLLVAPWQRRRREQRLTR